MNQEAWICASWRLLPFAALAFLNHLLYLMQIVNSRVVYIISFIEVTACSEEMAKCAVLTSFPKPWTNHQHLKRRLSYDSTVQEQACSESYFAAGNQAQQYVLYSRCLFLLHAGGH